MRDEAAYPTKTLGELIDQGAISIVNGFACGEHNSEGVGALHIRPFNITTTGSVDLSQQKHVPVAVAEGKPTIIGNDILFNNTNTKEPVGKAALWNGPEGCVYSNHMTRLRVLNPDVSPRYLATAIHAHWLAGRSQMLARAHVAQASILGERFGEIEIPWPQQSEQLAFGQVFDALHASLSVEAELINNAQSLRRAAMRMLFTRGLRGEGQKEIEIGLVPDSWTPTPCDQIFRLTSGKTRPSDLNSTPSTEKPYPVLGGNGVMGYSGSWNVDAPESLVIGRVGEYCGAVHIAIGKVWITDNALFAKEWLSSRARLQFVGNFLEYFDLNRFKRMAGQPLVTQSMINEHSIPLPDPEEQEEIVTILDAIDRKVDLHHRKRAALDELFKALLRKLVTGKIRAGDLNLSALGPSKVTEAA